jgi:hypothetical protein
MKQTVSLIVAAVAGALVAAGGVAVAQSGSGSNASTVTDTTSTQPSQSVPAAETQVPYAPVTQAQPATTDNSLNMPAGGQPSSATSSNGYVQPAPAATSDMNRSSSSNAAPSSTYGDNMGTYGTERAARADRN